jgi:hypothetical protein
MRNLKILLVKKDWPSRQFMHCIGDIRRDPPRLIFGEHGIKYENRHL